MNNFYKYENINFANVKVNKKNIKKSNFTYTFMATQAKKTGKTIFIAREWENWWPEASVRYGFKYKVIDETDSGYWIKIVSQNKPVWLK